MQESLGRKIPIQIVNKILDNVKDLHGVDAQERTVIFRSVFGDIWKKIMRDIHDNTPQYKVKISHDIIRINTTTDINDVVPAVISSTIMYSNARAGAGAGVGDLLLLNISSPDCNPKDPFVKKTNRFPGTSHVQFHRKIGMGK